MGRPTSDWVRTHVDTETRSGTHGNFGQAKLALISVNPGTHISVIWVEKACTKTSQNMYLSNNALAKLFRTTGRDYP